MRKNRMFLIELMIAVLFFLIVTAVSIRALALADSMSRESQALTNAVNAAANAAEAYMVWDGKQASFDALFPEGHWESETTWRLYYDADWQPQEVEGSYALIMQMKEKDGLGTAELTVVSLTGEEEELYQLTVKRRGADDR